MEPHQLAHLHDPDTSHGAIPAAEQRGKVKQALLNILEASVDGRQPRAFGGASMQGLTVPELRDHYFRQREIYGWPVVQPHSIARRLSELHKEGLVRDTGERSPGESGVSVAVWAKGE